MELLNGVFATADSGNVFREFGNATPLSNTICVQTRLVVITPTVYPKQCSFQTAEFEIPAGSGVFSERFWICPIFFRKRLSRNAHCPQLWLENHSGKNKTSHRIRENCTQDVNTASESRRTHEESIGSIEARTMCCLGKSTLDISPC